MLISFDPGKTTGVCVARNVNYAARSFDVTQSLELPWENRFFIRYALEKAKEIEEDGVDRLDAIIVESFRLSPSITLINSQIHSDFPSCQVIGIIGAYADLFGFGDRIVMQPPSNRKSASFPPEHLAKLKPRSAHARDAYQHLRYYVLMHKQGPTLKA